MVCTWRCSVHKSLTIHSNIWEITSLVTGPFRRAIRWWIICSLYAIRIGWNWVGYAPLSFLYIYHCNEAKETFSAVTDGRLIYALMLIFCRQFSRVDWLSAWSPRHVGGILNVDKDWAIMRKIWMLVGHGFSSASNVVYDVPVQYTSEMATFTVIGRMTSLPPHVYARYSGTNLKQSKHFWQNYIPNKCKIIKLMRYSHY